MGSGRRGDHILAPRRNALDCGVGEGADTRGRGARAPRNICSHSIHRQIATSSF
jgi:hypothetical protein